MGKNVKIFGQFFTLRDIESAFNPLAFRYLVLTSHYRSKLNFTWESLQAAQNALFRLNDELQIMNYESLAKQNKLTANKI